MTITRTAFALSTFLISAIGAHAAEMVTAKNGMTLYIFDKDKGGVSACYDDCAKNWPPYLGTADDKLTEGWTLVKRTDNTMQWAYDGKPVYFFMADKVKGDAAGDGKGGVWHVIKE
jgi:predicted lipoprotein with Yx(FWY)xxD motif